MNNSLKVGVVSGLIAGLVAGVVCEFSNQLADSLGLFAPYFRAINTGNMIIDVPVFGFWGIILGIIYSRAYSLVPRKGILKGVIYGLFIWFIVKVRIETFEFAWGRTLQAAGAIVYGFLMWLSYGVVLGLLYDFLHMKYQPAEEKLKIRTYDMRGGVLPGAIAGVVGGFAASVVAMASTLGLIEYPEGFVPFSLFWLSESGALIVLNLIWGAIFGAVFPRVYYLVPAEKVKKGLCYALILFLITDLLIWTYVWPWAVYHNALPTADYVTWSLLVNNGAYAVVFGLVLGALYRKPSD